MYKVLIDTLNHNGRLRQPGELIEMDAVDAAPLIKIGAIEAAAVTVNPQPSGTGDQDMVTGNATITGGDPSQQQPGNNPEQSTVVQQQPAASAQAGSGTAPGAPKTGRKDSKPKTE